MLSKDFFSSQLLLNWATRILFFTSLSALLPTFPLYIEDIGGSKSQIGIIMSAFAVGVLIFRPMVGKQVDTVGRKAVLLAGCFIFIISPILYIYTPSIALLFPLRIFHGLGLAAFGTASITLITDAAPLPKRADVISYTGMVNTVAFTLGPVLGSFVGNTWGHATLFLFVAALSFACFVCSAFVQETRKDKTQEKQVNYWQAIKQRRILISFAMVLLIGLVHGGVIFYISTFIKDTVEINEGLFFAIYGIAAFAVRAAVGPLSKRIGRGPLMILSLLFLMAGVFSLSVTHGTILLFIAAICYGLGFGSHQPNLTTLVADNTREETRGKIFSFYYGGFDLGISLAGIVLGLIAEHFGIRSMFIVCGALAITSLSLFATGMEGSVVQSLQCALSFRNGSADCYTCDQMQEDTPEQADAYFGSRKDTQATGK